MGLVSDLKTLEHLGLFKVKIEIEVKVKVEVKTTVGVGNELLMASVACLRWRLS